MEDGLLPHQRSVTDGARHIDEERRLAYVGVTRAQEFLTITMSKTRMRWGKARPSLVSRFVMEMRGETERAKRAAEASVAMMMEAQKLAEKAAAGAASKKPVRKRRA